MIKLAKGKLDTQVVCTALDLGCGSPIAFVPYAAYKLFSNEWADKLPTHWKIASLKWVSRIFAGGTPDRTKVHYWEDGSIPWLNSGAVNQVLVSEPSSYITEQGFNSSSARWAPAGSLVMALAGQGKTKGMVAQLAIPATCNQSLAAIIPATQVEARYLFWWLSNNYQNVRNMAGGDLRDGLNLELLGSIPVPLPCRTEQTQIARFLDHETARIDALLEEQQRLIELLKEKRQAVISHAVTKGLDPMVPMKDSGVEWLGEVPAHWDVGGLTRFIGPVVDYRGRTPTKMDDGVFLVTARNIRGGRIDYEASEEYVDPDSAESLLARGRPEIGDLLFTMEAPLGQVALIDRTDIALAQRVVKFRGNPNMIRNGYLMYWLMSTNCQARLETLATGSTALGIKSSKLGMIECLCPTLKEQDAIVSYIQGETAKNDTLVCEAEQIISLLQERRSALISAAVTGKIDVRSWQPPAGAQAPELAHEAA